MARRSLDLPREVEQEMIIFVYGTTAELIKMAPVFVRVSKHGAVTLTLCTAQQADEVSVMADNLGLPQPDVLLANGVHGRPLEQSRDVIPWLTSVLVSFTRSYRRLRAEVRKSRTILLVQGDTFTAVLGAFMGRLLRVRVGHIEAGMRSGDIWNPFPEELNRRLITWLAHYHFAPGAGPSANLRRRPGEVVNTGANTVRDSLESVTNHLDNIEGLAKSLPSRFGIVSLHRSELLNNRDLFTETLTVLAEFAKSTSLVFIDHAVTAEAVRASSLDHLFDEQFIRVRKLPYHSFAALMRRSSFAVTDSGGLQEESYYLGLPCLVHRFRTERAEGLGRNAVLSGFDAAVLKEFLDDPERYRLNVPESGPSPSEIIVDTLVQKGFCP
jgi:UDP-N-acetylglucosamine 2-epimerase (non-hydrolysing)